MKEYFKNLWRAITGNPAVVYRDKEENYDDTVKNTIIANRHYVRSIGVEHFDSVYDDMNESQKKDHAAQASVVWTNEAFRKELKHAIAQQLIFIGEQCQSWDQALIGRGTVNGIGLIEDRFRKLHSEHLQEIKGKVGEEEDDFPHV